MGNKKVLVIILVVVVIAAGATAYFIFFKKPSGVMENQPTDINQSGGSTQLPSGNDNQAGQPGSDNNTPVRPESKLSQSEVDAVALARFFIEMMGTYSPEAKFQNIIDLQPLMTEAMKTWSQDLIKRNREGQLSEAVTTRVAKIEVISADETEAKIRATARRTSVEAGEEKNYNQEVEVTLIKGADGWKANSLTWQ